MFNREAQRGVVTSHQNRDNMSRSRKRLPYTLGAGCKSQKRGKQVCNRKFRHRERQNISMGKFEHLPHHQIEVMDQWDLGYIDPFINREDEWLTEKDLGRLLSPEIIKTVEKRQPSSYGYGHETELSYWQIKNAWWNKK